MEPRELTQKEKFEQEQEKLKEKLSIQLSEEEKNNAVLQDMINYFRPKNKSDNNNIILEIRERNEGEIARAISNLGYKNFSPGTAQLHMQDYENVQPIMLKFIETDMTIENLPMIYDHVLGAMAAAYMHAQEIMNNSNNQEWMEIQQAFNKKEDDININSEEDVNVVPEVKDIQRFKDLVCEGYLLAIAQHMQDEFAAMYGMQGSNVNSMATILAIAVGQHEQLKQLANGSLTPTAFIDHVYKVSKENQLLEKKLASLYTQTLLYSQKNGLILNGRETINLSEKLSDAEKNKAFVQHVLDFCVYRSGKPAHKCAESDVARAFQDPAFAKFNPGVQQIYLQEYLNLREKVINVIDIKVSGKKNVIDIFDNVLGPMAEAYMHAHEMFMNSPELKKLQEDFLNDPPTDNDNASRNIDDFVAAACRGYVLGVVQGMYVRDFESHFRDQFPRENRKNLEKLLGPVASNCGEQLLRLADYNKNHNGSPPTSKDFLDHLNKVADEYEKKNEPIVLTKNLNDFKARYEVKEKKEKKEKKPSAGFMSKAGELVGFGSKGKVTASIPNNTNKNIESSTTTATSTSSITQPGKSVEQKAVDFNADGGDVRERVKKRGSLRSLSLTRTKSREKITNPHIEPSQSVEQKTNEPTTSTSSANINTSQISESVNKPVEQKPAEFNQPDEGEVAKEKKSLRDSLGIAKKKSRQVVNPDIKKTEHSSTLQMTEMMEKHPPEGKFHDVKPEQKMETKKEEKDEKEDKKSYFQSKKSRRGMDSRVEKDESSSTPSMGMGKSSK